jgi:hypothetical protein
MKILGGDQLGTIDLKPLYLPVLAHMADNGRPDISECLEKEIVGGNCKYCRKPYASHHVTRKWWDVTVFRPTCECAPICPICGHRLDRELDLDEKYCMNCGPIPCFYPTEQEIETDRGNVKRVKPCPGLMAITLHGWKCTDCDNTVMPIYRRGETLIRREWGKEKRYRGAA